MEILIDLTLTLLPYNGIVRFPFFKSYLALLGKLIKNSVTTYNLSVLIFFFWFNKYVCLMGLF